MVKTENFMNAVKDAITSYEDDFCEYLHHLEPSVSNGSDAPGFWNFTDGFVDWKCLYTPRSDDMLSFKGFDDESNARAKEVQELADGYWHNTDNSTDSYWYDNIRGTENESRWADSKTFVQWYNGYEPNSSDELDEIYFDCQEYNDNWFSESPAFTGVTIRLYDPENSRNESGKTEAVIESYFNDDFSYGRDSISWSKGVGKHVVYSAEFTYDGIDDLVKKIHEHMPKVCESIQ